MINKVYVIKEYSHYEGEPTLIGASNDEAYIESCIALLEASDDKCTYVKECIPFAYSRG